MHSSMYQLDNLVISLLESINDKNTEVQESVCESLVALGRKRAEFIFKASFDFVIKNQAKLSDPHKSLIFNTIEKIVKEDISKLDEILAQNWIEVATNEMIQMREKENPIVLQTAASNLLVAIGKQYVKQVFGQLQKNFVAGQLPHLFVINTMAYLAEVNPYGVVPNLTGVLTSMLPMLGMAKQDIYKISFASALCKFSEAIIYYCSNKEKAPDQSIEKSYFSTQIYAAFEIFFNHWVKSGDAKLRHTTIEALGYFVNLIAHEKLDTEVPKIVPGLLNLYKKHSDPFIVSQSLSLSINAIITATPVVASMDVVFDPLVKELFAQVVACLEQQSAKNMPPAALVASGKNQNELLRCFAELAKKYSDRLLPFLLQKFEQNNEKNRIASLTVIKHLINSCGEQMANKKQLAISGIRVILNETNPRVKKNILQTIIAMAYHGYLGLEGGNLMIDFVLKQCSLPDDNPNDKKQQQSGPDEFTNENLRSSAESILTLFSTTVENMHGILWPSLFEYLNQPEYSRAAAILCKSLAHIAETKRAANADDFEIKFESFINIPKPFEILARLCVLAGVPLVNAAKNRALNALALMRNMAPNIDPLIVELWDNAVPKLIANLEDKLENKKFVQKTWEDLIMKLLSTSLDQIGNEEKLCEIAKALGRQIETLYTQNSDEKHFAFKCMGLILNKTLSKSTIDRQLDIVFTSVNHTVNHEREGCAIAFGYTASSHLDSVLLKLETYAKNETKKSSGGLFSGIIKDSKGSEPDLVKSTIVIAYGYVTFFAPKDLIISRLEANILRSVSGYVSVPTKELTFRQSILKSLDTITRCMHPDHLKKEFNFSYKSTILNQIMTYISSDNSKVLQNDLKAACYKICANLVKLTPKPTDADLFQLIKISTDSFYPLQMPAPSTPTPANAEKQPELSSESAASNEELLHGNALYDQTSRALDEMLNTILDQDRTNDGLNGVFKHIEPWLTSVNEWERLRSIKSLSRTLKHFLELLQASAKTENEETRPEFEFALFGYILGRIVSRCTDPSIVIRNLAIECIESLLGILDNSSKKRSEDKIETLLEQLAQIRNKLIKTDSNVLLAGVNELSKLICKHIPPGQQLIVFIEKLIDGLLDVESHCSSASCLLLNYCVKLRGAELKDQVENLIRHLYTKLGLIQNPQAKLGTLRTLRVIFQQHLTDALGVFLTFPIPCTKDTIDICQSLCEDSQLISDILEFILQLWNRCLPYEEKNGIKFASLTPLIATAILNEIFSNNTTANTEQVFNQNFEKIFSAMLVRTASTLSSSMPIPKPKDDSQSDSKKDSKNAKNEIQNEYKKLDPCKISIDCFKSYIKCTQSYDLFEYLNKENAWELLGQESTHVEGCSILARGLCLHADRYISGILQNLNLFLSAPYDCQKISVTAFYAELMNHSCCLGLIDTLMNSLLTKLIDTCTLVRTLCIRGLGNMASLGAEPVQRHSTTILSAMMAGLDDKDDLSDDISHESMTSLAKIITLIDESNVRPILINILLRVRPCFEKEKAHIRASSYNLFGELARFGKGPSRDPFMEQVHSNFVGFVLHLNEADPKVKLACRRVLRQVGPLMDSKNIEKMFEEALPENKTSLHYGEFINDLAKILVNDFPDKVSFYIMNSVSNFKSQWTEIRCNAVLFAGYLLGFLSKDKQSLLSKEHISNALVKLLKEDPSPLVRKKAAEAISLLSEF